MKESGQSKLFAVKIKTQHWLTEGDL